MINFEKNRFGGLAVMSCQPVCKSQPENQVTGRQVGQALRAWGVQFQVVLANQPDGGFPTGDDWEDRVLTCVRHDTQQLAPGGLFVCIQGARAKAGFLCLQAAARGAGAVVIQQDQWDEESQGLTTALAQAPKNLVWIVVSDIWAARAAVYEAFYPCIPQHRVAVTGTDGKTSVTTILSQMWDAAGTPWAAVGTLGVRTWPTLIDAASFVFEGMSTPVGDLFYDLMRACHTQNIQHLTFEATSHSLHQRRLYPLRATTAVFTTFSRDHMDYHGTQEAYWQAKCLIVEDLKPQKVLMHSGIGKAHPDRAWQLAARAAQMGAQVIFYGPAQDAVVGAVNATYHSFHQRAGDAGAREDFANQGGVGGALSNPANIHLANVQGYVRWSMDGQVWVTPDPGLTEFQKDNVLAALCAFKSEGGCVDQVIDALPRLIQVPGRLEYIGTYNGGRLYVDYAHTPQALEKVLRQMRPQIAGKLGVVFGCGGERDQGKRPVMGQVGQAWADWVVVTDDNPRTEDPALIRQAILKECPKAVEIPDRGQAIAYGMARLQPGDGLIVAGKGHEQMQLIGDQRVPFCDRVCIQAVMDLGNSHDPANMGLVHQVAWGRAEALGLAGGDTSVPGNGPALPGESDQVCDLDKSGQILEDSPTTVWEAL